MGWDAEWLTLLILIVVCVLQAGLQLVSVYECAFGNVKENIMFGKKKWSRYTQWWRWEEILRCRVTEVTDFVCGVHYGQVSSRWAADGCWWSSVREKIDFGEELSICKSVWFAMERDGKTWGGWQTNVVYGVCIARRGIAGRLHSSIRGLDIAVHYLSAIDE